MSDILLTEGIWENITKAVKKHSRKCYVAVAYFSKQASEMLPLEEGSLLVFNMSQDAVKAGQTNPAEVLKLLIRGVSVNSVKNLHAKVFVAGGLAFVGSTNVSNHSANRLQEATLQTTNPNTVKQCREFVEGLAGEVVTPEYARRMKKLYKPPKIAGGGKVRTTTAPLHEPLWLVPLVRESWDEEAQRQEKLGLPKARKRFRSSKKFRIEQFHWSGQDFLKKLGADDLLVQVMAERNGTTMVSPAARVLHIQSYLQGRGHHAIVFLEVPKNPLRKNIVKVIQRLGSRAKRDLGSLEDPKLLRDPSLVHSLLNLWPSAKGT